MDLWQHTKLWRRPQKHSSNGRISRICGSRSSSHISDEQVAQFKIHSIYDIYRNRIMLRQFKTQITLDNPSWQLRLQIHDTTCNHALGKPSVGHTWQHCRWSEESQWVCRNFRMHKSNRNFWKWQERSSRLLVEIRRGWVEHEVVGGKHFAGENSSWSMMRR